MSDFELRVSENELNLVLTALGQMPYAQVAELMVKLSEQIGAQMEALQAAEAPEPVRLPRV